MAQPTAATPAPVPHLRPYIVHRDDLKYPEYCYCVPINFALKRPGNDPLISHFKQILTALLNTSGGVIVLVNHDVTPPKEKDLDTWKLNLPDCLSSIIPHAIYRDTIDFITVVEDAEYGRKSLHMLIKKSSELITYKSHLYTRSIASTKMVHDSKGICKVMQCKSSKSVAYRDVEKYNYGDVFNVSEGKHIEFKHWKAVKTFDDSDEKRKGNTYKFRLEEDRTAKTIFAFANSHKGGYLLIGVENESLKVRGQHISKEDEEKLKEFFRTFLNKGKMGKERIGGYIGRKQREGNIASLNGADISPQGISSSHQENGIPQQESRTVYQDLGSTQEFEPSISESGTTPHDDIEVGDWTIKFIPVEEGPVEERLRLILIHMNHYPGGVFSQCPEAYFVGKEGVIMQMTFDYWKATCIQASSPKEVKLAGMKSVETQHTVDTKSASTQWPDQTLQPVTQLGESETLRESSSPSSVTPNNEEPTSQSQITNGGDVVYQDSLSWSKHTLRWESNLDDIGIDIEKNVNKFATRSAVLNMTSPMNFTPTRKTIVGSLKRRHGEKVITDAIDNIGNNDNIEAFGIASSHWPSNLQISHDVPPPQGHVLDVFVMNKAGRIKLYTVIEEFSDEKEAWKYVRESARLTKRSMLYNSHSQMKRVDIPCLWVECHVFKLKSRAKSQMAATTQMNDRSQMAATTEIADRTVIAAATQITAATQMADRSQMAETTQIADRSHMAETTQMADRSQMTETTQMADRSQMAATTQMAEFFSEETDSDQMKHALTCVLLSKCTRLRSLFGDDLSITLTAEQMEAVLKVELNKFNYISGPPGSGKTYIALYLYQKFHSCGFLVSTEPLKKFLEFQRVREDDILVMPKRKHYVKKFEFENIPKFKLLLVDDAQNIERDKQDWNSLFEKVCMSEDMKLVVLGDSIYQQYKESVCDSSFIMHEFCKCKHLNITQIPLSVVHRNTRKVVSFMKASFSDSSGYPGYTQLQCSRQDDGDDIEIIHVHVPIYGDFKPLMDFVTSLVDPVKTLENVEHTYESKEIAILVDQLYEKNDDGTAAKKIRNELIEYLERDDKIEKKNNSNRTTDGNDGELEAISGRSIEGDPSSDENCHQHRLVHDAGTFPVTGYTVDTLERFTGLDRKVCILVAGARVVESSEESGHSIANPKYRTFVASRGISKVVFITPKPPTSAIAAHMKLDNLQSAVVVTRRLWHKQAEQGIFDLCYVTIDGHQAVVYIRNDYILGLMSMDGKMLTHITVDDPGVQKPQCIASDPEGSRVVVAGYDDRQGPYHWTVYGTRPGRLHKRRRFNLDTRPKSVSWASDGHIIILMEKVNGDLHDIKLFSVARLSTEDGSRLWRYEASRINLKDPSCVSVSTDPCHIYVADGHRNCVVKLSGKGRHARDISTPAIDRLVRVCTDSTGQGFFVTGEESRDIFLLSPDTTSRPVIQAPGHVSCMRRKGTHLVVGTEREGMSMYDVSSLLH